MASAPGQSSAQQEPVCYNCGLKGHWVVACPEPTRDVPAGLKRWQSQHHEQTQRQRPERHNSGAEKKPPVVTRYAPPPAYTPPAAQYGQPPPPPYPPAGQPPYPPAPYPPPQQQPPYYGSGYPPPPPPNQAPYGSYPPHHQPPPPPPFNQHIPPPPHPGYGPPPPPNQYPHLPPGNQYPQPPPPQPGYYSGPQPPYPPAPYQPQQPYPPPPQNYQMPYAPGPPPPPPNYQQAPYPPAPYPPNPGQGYPPAPLPPPPMPPPPVSYSPDNTWNQPPPPHASQPPRYERQKNKKRRDRDRPKPKGHRGPDRDRRSPVLKAVIPELEDPLSNEGHLPQSQDEPEPGEVAEDIDGDDTFEDWDVEVAKHFDIVFAESEGKPADPVGIPLPHIYTDNPTIPPAYNAKCIKSEYFREDAEDEFIVPVQRTKEWQFLMYDPAFKRYPGMIARQFEPDGPIYMTYEPPARHPEGAPVRLPPRFRIDRQERDRIFQRQRFPAGEGSPNQSKVHGRDRQSFSRGNNDRDGDDFCRRQDATNRSYSGTPNNRPAKRGFEDSRHNTDNRDYKRHRRSPSHQDTPPSTNRNHASQRSPPRPDHERSAWSPNAEDAHAHSTSHHHSHRQRSKSVNPRHDSGYHSGETPPDKSSHRRTQDKDEEQHYRRPRRRSRSRGRSYSRSRSPAAGSRASSATASDDRSRRSSSPLTAMDYELLGISRPKERRDGAAGMGARRVVKRQVKVSAAYGRRW